MYLTVFNMTACSKFGTPWCHHCTDWSLITQRAYRPALVAVLYKHWVWLVGIRWYCLLEYPWKCCFSCPWKSLKTLIWSPCEPCITVFSVTSFRYSWFLLNSPKILCAFLVLSGCLFSFVSVMCTRSTITICVNFLMRAASCVMIASNKLATSLHVLKSIDWHT